MKILSHFLLRTIQSTDLVLCYRNEIYKFHIKKMIIIVYIFRHCVSVIFFSFFFWRFWKKCCSSVIVCDFIHRDSFNHMHVCIVQKEKYVHLDAICDLRGIAKNKNTKQNKTKTHSINYQPNQYTRIVRYYIKKNNLKKVAYAFTFSTKRSLIPSRTSLRARSVDVVALGLIATITTCLEAFYAIFSNTTLFIQSKTNIN